MSSRYSHLETEIRLLKEERDAIVKSNAKLKDENEELATSANDLLEEIEAAEKSQQKVRLVCLLVCLFLLVSSYSFVCSFVRWSVRSFVLIGLLLWFEYQYSRLECTKD
jgi:hypothetical protein